MKKACEDLRNLFKTVQRRIWNQLLKDETNENLGKIRIIDRFEEEKNHIGFSSKVVYTKLSNGLFLIEDAITETKRISMQPVETIVVGRDEEQRGLGDCGLGYEISLVLDTDGCGLQIIDSAISDIYAGIMFYQDSERDYAILPINIYDSEVINWSNNCNNTGITATNNSKNVVEVKGEEVQNSIEEFLQIAISILGEEGKNSKYTIQIYKKALELLGKVQELTGELTVGCADNSLLDTNLPYIQENSLFKRIIKKIKSFFEKKLIIAQ